MAKIGLPDFLFGMKWKPSNGLYGIFPFILGSIYVTAGAIVVGVPTALLLAIFLAFYCPKQLYSPLKAMVNLLAGTLQLYMVFWSDCICTAAASAYRS